MLKFWQNKIKIISKIFAAYQGNQYSSMMIRNCIDCKFKRKGKKLTLLQHQQLIRHILANRAGTGDDLLILFGVKTFKKAKSNKQCWLCELRIHRKCIRRKHHGWIIWNWTVIRIDEFDSIYYNRFLFID